MVPKNNKHQSCPLHVQKKMHSDTDPCLSCESNFCMNYIYVSAFRTGCCSKYFFSRACCSAGRNFGFLGGPGDESFDEILKVETIKNCKELNTTSLKNNITAVVSLDAENFTHLSVYHGKKHYSARLKGFIVMFTKETCLLHCRCCDRKINCIHKAMAMWFLKQTEQL